MIVWGGWNGATGVNILFDLPTIRGYDSDDRQAEGNVGQCGAAVDSLWDMEAFFADIDLSRISTSIVTHLPSTSLVIPGMYLELGEAFANKLIGAFAIAVWDPRNRRLTRAPI